MKVALYLQVWKDEDWPYLHSFLQRWFGLGGDVLVNLGCHEELSRRWNGKSVGVYDSHSTLPEDTSLMVSFGGDGTMLRATTFLKDSDIPLVGVNTGRLGFLSTVHKELVDRLVVDIFQRKYSLERRRLLQVYCDGGEDIFGDLNFALNEVAISRKDTTSMITIETYLNDEFLTAYWADGLIVSSPTGSTGYSLSCGGPVISPDVKAWVLTPIAPHNLSARPLVVPDDTQIRVKVSGREDSHLVSLDSRIFSVPNHWEFRISRAGFDLNMLVLPDDSFWKTLRKKLLWGEDQRN